MAFHNMTSICYPLTYITIDPTFCIYYFICLCSATDSASTNESINDDLHLDIVPLVGPVFLIILLICQVKPKCLV